MRLSEFIGDSSQLCRTRSPRRVFSFRQLCAVCGGGGGNIGSGPAADKDVFAFLTRIDCNAAKNKVGWANKSCLSIPAHCTQCADIKTAISTDGQKHAENIRHRKGANPTKSFPAVQPR